MPRSTVQENNPSTEILDAKYEWTDVVEVMKELTHLNAHQKADLL